LSSILKALKKIEQDESHGGKEKHVWPDSVHYARKSVQKKNRKKVVLLLLVFFCCVLAAGIIYTGSKINFPDKTKTESIPDRKNKTKSLVSLAVKTSPEVTVAKQNKQPPEKTTSKIEEIDPGRVSKTTPEVPLSEIKTDEALLQKDDIIPDSKMPESTPTVIEPEEDLPEIKNDSRLKIQAIAWAEEPSRRFVVINNSIVREGGTIDSITVVSIEDNIIHFNENGNTWRQRFVIR